MKLRRRKRDRIDAGHLGGGLDQSLERIVGLGPAGATIRAHLHGVGEDAAHVHGDVRDVIHAREAAREIVRGDRCAVRRQHRADGGDRRDLQGQEAAFGIEREPCRCDRVARLVVALERFGAARHPVHRAPDLLCRDQHRDIFRIRRGLHAEGAADIAGQQPHLLRRDDEAGGKLVAQHARALRRHAQEVFVFRRVVACRRATRLHRGDDDALVDLGHFRHVRGASELTIDPFELGVVARCRRHEVEGDIARRFGPELRRAGCDGVLDIDDRGKRLIVDGDDLRGVLGDLECFGDYQHDGLADEHDAVLGEGGPERLDDLRSVASEKGDGVGDRARAGRANVVGRHYCKHAGQGAGLGGIDRPDRSAGVRRADKATGRGAFDADIVHEAAFAAQQCAVLDARRPVGGAMASVGRHQLANCRKGLIACQKPSGSWIWGECPQCASSTSSAPAMPLASA
jgi:hypothetical protein